jgi:uncharacterized membrane protein YagU involved in acid resistance
MSGEVEVRKPMTWQGKRLAVGDRIARKTIIAAVGDGRLRSMERLGWLVEAPPRRRSSKTVEPPEEAHDGIREEEETPAAE